MKQVCGPDNKSNRQFRLRHKKMAVSSTCNDGWHAYKAWFIPLELGMIVRNGCTSHNSLSSLSTSRKFSFLQRSLTSSSRHGVGQKTCRCE